MTATGSGPGPAAARRPAALAPERGRRRSVACPWPSRSPSAAGLVAIVDEHADRRPGRLRPVAHGLSLLPGRAHPRLPRRGRPASRWCRSCWRAIRLVVPDPVIALDLLNGLLLAASAGDLLPARRDAAVEPMGGRAEPRDRALLITDRFLELFAFGGLLQAAAVMFMGLTVVAAFVRAARAPRRAALVAGCGAARWPSRSLARRRRA